LTFERFTERVRQAIVLAQDERRPQTRGPYMVSA
jgi:hypothetical protein